MEMKQIGSKGKLGIVVMGTGRTNLAFNCSISH
ncbi:hypothetical protein IIM_04955 [Bacillus cereus VD107]|nr:hypothetical protein IIM_04955 [Bacillus cereus VD107]QDD87303.1 hypothetical protein FORC087_519 [Bacillus cereus]